MAKGVADSTLIGSLQVILAGICWGSLGIFSSKLGQAGFDSWQITSLRIVTAFVLILVFLPKILPIFKRLTKAEWSLLVAQSWIGVLGMTLCYFFAVKTVGVGMAVALLYTAPVFSLVLARLVLKESISVKSVLLAVVAVIGVAFLMLGDAVSLNVGMLVGLLSGLCYSLYGILGKKAMSSEGGLSAGGSQLLFFSSISISAASLLVLPSTYATYGQLVSLPSTAVLWVMGLSFVGTIVPFLLYMRALQKLPATTASVFTIFEPLTAIVLASVLLSQSPKPLQMVGIALIIGATLANALGSKNAPQKSPS